MVYATYIKRFLDIVCSVVSLVLLSPLFLIVAVWIKLDSEGPVFFRQKRFGRGKTFFYIYKFRTMKKGSPHDVPTHLFKHTSRYLTRCGRLLRRTSIDELPQIVNILLGQMSFVGPRPALWNQEDLIAERDKYDANAVRPGLTGLAQVNGRDTLPSEIKAKYDGEYAKRITFGGDMRCVLKTVRAVVKHEGVAEDDKSE